MGKLRHLTSTLLGTLMIAAAPGHAHSADAGLIEAARGEGRVVWLTTQIMGELALPMAAAFKVAYGIEVTVMRASQRAMSERVATADRSGQNIVDVVDGRSAIAQMKRAGLLAAVDIGNAARLPTGLADPQKMWFATNVFTISAAVNTDLVPAPLRPRSLDDLLKPQWTGRMAWSQQATLSAATGFIGAALRDKGDEKGRAFLQRLSRQQIAGFDGSSGEIIEKVITGDFALALQVYAHQTAAGAGRNAPLAWLALPPVTGSFAAIGVTKRASHPHAARLLVEFMLSRQGQEIVRDAGQQPALPDVAPSDPALAPGTGRFEAHFFNPEEVDAQMPAWEALRQTLFPDK